MSQQPSDQCTHSIQASSRDGGSHRRVQVYPVERTSETPTYDPSRVNPPAPGDPQYQTPQNYMPVNASSRTEAEEDLERVPWREGPSQTAGAFYTQDSRATHFLSSPPTAIHSSRDHQHHVPGWEAEGQGRRGSEPGYDHRDAYGFGSPREPHRGDAVPMVPGGDGSHTNIDHGRHGPPMVSRHPSLQSFGPYTTTVLHPGRNPSALSGAGDHHRSHSTSHTLYSAQQQFQTHQALRNAEAPQYVVPSSRIPRADLTARASASPPGYYNTAGVSHGPEEMSETKPKRRRANAAQLQLLNDTYARTMFPTTEERADIARRINMTPRQVQIWFQNRRQASRQCQALEPGTPSGLTLEGIYGEGHSDYLHEPEND